MAAAMPFARSIGRPTALAAASASAASAPPSLPLSLPARRTCCCWQAWQQHCALQAPRGHRVAAFASRSGGGGPDGASGPKRRRKDGGGGRAAAAPAPPPPPPRPPGAPPDQPAPTPEVGWMWSGSGSGGRAAATKQSLKSAGLRAKKSLGQNFLTDEAVLARIVRAAGVGPGDRVLEVGPGTGNLTRHLIAAGSRVTAVEKDDALAARLREAAPGLEGLVHGDVLRVGLGSVVARMLRPAGGGGRAGGGGGDGGGGGGGDEGASKAPSASSSSPSPSSSSSPSAPLTVKIVANLPYNITKEFLLASLPLGGALDTDDAGAGGGDHADSGADNGGGGGGGGGVSEVTLMLEEDAARRLADPRPSRPDYRAMSVLVHRWSAPRYLFRIPRDRYYPAPGVDGAMVTFALVAPRDRPALPLPPGAAAERAHAALVNAAFSERRKMMRNVLTSGLGRGGRAWGAPTRDPAVVARALLDVGARDEARPQELSSAQFAAFHCALTRRAAEAGGVDDGGEEGGYEDDEDDFEKAGKKDRDE